jgi:hypothetical protein
LCFCSGDLIKEANASGYQEEQITIRKNRTVAPPLIKGVMTEKTGLFRRLEAFEKLMVAANAEATVAVAYLTEKESSEEFGESVEALAEESEQLWRKVARLLDAAGNENLDL